MRSILPLVVFMFLAAAGLLRGDEAEDRAQDIAQMKRVWEALMAYKKESGALPERLGDLVPKYLPDAKDLVSPRDDGEHENGPLTKKEEKYPSSYGYEWGPQKFRNLTFSEVKTCQVEEYGPVVPLLRCFLYTPVLNISHAGDFYETDTNWEISPAVEEIIAKRGLGPGTSKGKFLDLLVTDTKGAPLEGVKVTAQNRFIEGIWLPVRSITSGKDGRARMPFGPVRAMSGNLLFEKAGHFAFPEHSENFPETFRVSMQQTKTISGVVTDVDGKPLSNAAVLLKREAPAEKGDDEGDDWLVRSTYRTFDPHRIGLVRTDANGKWKIEECPDSLEWKFQCTFSQSGCAVQTLSLDAQAFERDGYYSGTAKIALAKPFRVRGKLTSPDGSPSAKASLFLYSSHDPTDAANPLSPVEATSGEDGAFEFPARVPGLAKIAVVPKSAAAPVVEEVTIRKEMPDLELKLVAGRVLKGKVQNAAKQPISGVSILYFGWSMDIQIPLNPVVATSDAEGNWEWKNAPTFPPWGGAVLPSGNLIHWWDRGNNLTITVPLGEEQ